MTGMTSRRFRPKNKARRRRFYKRKGFWLTLLLLLGVGVGAAWLLVAYSIRPYRERAATYDLDKIDDLEVPSLILDRNGHEIGRIFVENRSVIRFADIPQRMIDALKAGEDRRFDHHNGVDYIGIVRAFYENWQAGETTQGGSTITQQLARNAFNLKDEARRRKEGPYERKLVEAFLARRIERRFTKDEIVELYLNRIYFGSGYYGLRSAALGYFGKEPRDLTTLECATIVGVIKRPNDLSPLNSPEASRRSRNRVLERMRESRMIKRRELAEWTRQPVKPNPRPLQRGTSHLYERVAAEMLQRLGEERFSAGGFRIHTTIDRDAQRAAEEAVEIALARAEARPGYQHPRHADYRSGSGQSPEYLQGAALLVDHTTGDVLAHVGGRDYGDAPFDFIVHGRRPAGTVFFPFVYAAGLEAGLTPAAIVADEAMDNRAVMVGGREGILGEWGMETERPSYEGAITARRAFEMSKIAATVRFGNQAGLQRVKEACQRFGLHLPEGELLPRMLVGSEAVSLPELVRAFAAFARGGELGPRNLVYISRIEDAAGEPVHPLSAPVARRERATDPATAFQLHSMLQGSLAHGTAAEAAGQLLQQPFPGGAKTGSTHGFSDCWFVGYNSRVSCGVWVGFLQGAGKPIYDGAFSKDLAMPVWTAAMNAARPAFGGEAIVPPATLAEVPVCRVSGQRATRYCYETIEDPETGVPMTRPSAVPEWFRVGGPAIPFCAVHGGDDDAIAPGAPALAAAAVLNVVPIRPRSPALLGEDPYNALTVALAGDSQTQDVPVGFPRRGGMMESIDLGDEQSEISLPAPRRLEIRAE